MYAEIKEYYDLKDFILALYGECLENDSDDLDVEYAHCELWVNNKSLKLHICDGED